MKTAADVLGAARSNLAVRLRKHPIDSQTRRGPYAILQDMALLPELRRLTDERPTSGYRRIAALLNRARRKEGLLPVSRKRVLRILQRNALTLQRHTGLWPGRTHDGAVIALKSDIRWCSDHLELTCRNGDIVRVLFVIDACDREIIAWSAVAHAGVSGEMVRDLMVEAAERRFGGTKIPHPVEWLSDNGSAYIARPTVETAAALGRCSRRSARPKAMACRRASSRR